MKSDLKTYLEIANNQHQAINWMREYLQARILAALQDQGGMIALAFHGGTALRFLYHLPRYSEDLDFSLENADQDFNFQAYLDAISNQLILEGYPIRVKFNDQKIVHHAFISFPGLLFELGLSPHQDQNFTVKLEVDTHPPRGASMATTLIRYRELFLNIHHHDKASLLAGKVHAVLQRNYLKGRDIYDLLWYLSDRSWPLPNFVMLNNALDQSGWDGNQLSTSNWKSVILNQLPMSDFQIARQDVIPFLVRSEDQIYLKWETLSELLAE